jgi:hypothetical protein
MRKMVILRSIGGRARAYADKHFKRAVWFDDLASALTALKAGERPWFVVVDGRQSDLGAGAQAANYGYMVETKGVP